MANVLRRIRWRWENYGKGWRRGEIIRLKYSTNHDI